MRRDGMCALVALMACVTGADSAVAAFPFVEHFNTSAENWKQNSAGTVAPIHVGSGGPDGGPHISQTLTLPAYTPPGPMGPVAPIVFRAHQVGFNSSNSEYAGDWLAAGVKEVTAYIRHDASTSVVFNARFADPANNPGASYQTSAVPPNVWTKLTIDVTPSSPQLISYGSGTHGAIFDNIGNMQFGAVVPAGWPGGIPVKFDLDRVTVGVPEPATCGMGLVLAAGLWHVRRRRNS